MRKMYVAVGMILIVMPFAAATAQDVTVEVTNNQTGIGMAFSPPWIAFHDGTFDPFNAGMAASAGTEGIAELGDPTAINMEFAASGASGVTGMVMSPNDPPPFIPGESGSLMLNVGDATMNRYFSFGSMLVPSNDFFLGNDNPTAYEIFDAAGNFLGPIVIQVFSDDAWDAGTEMNDLLDGSAFIVGQDATMGTPESGVVSSLFDVAGINDYLAAMVGMETPIGTFNNMLTPDELVATITITPEPGSLALLALGLAALARRR